MVVTTLLYDIVKSLKLNKTAGYYLDKLFAYQPSF